MNKFKMYGLTMSMAAIIGLAGAGVAAQAEGSANEITVGALPVSSEVELATPEDDAKTGDADSGKSDKSVADIVEEVMPSMVAITNKSVTELRDYYNSYGGFGSFFDDFFGYGGFGGYGNGGYGNGGYGNSPSREVEQVSAGSGVVVAEDDDNFYIATNAHVVSDATELSVAFIDESTASAETVGVDSDADLAIIKVAKKNVEKEALDNIRVIRFGSSEDLRIGEDVIAIGNALGYGQSVSKGIVSALDRTIRTLNENTGSYDENSGMIQTDASINPGNSGGALINMSGELVGINSAKYSNTQIEGMGYAISIDVAEPILTDLANGRNTDETKADWAKDYSDGVKLGVNCVTVTEEMASQYDIPVGVYIQSVEEVSAAAQAGIHAGDVLTELNGEPVTTVDDLQEILNGISEGDTVEAKVSRMTTDAFGTTVYQDTTINVTFLINEDAEEAEEHQPA